MSDEIEIPLPTITKLLVENQELRALIDIYDEKYEELKENYEELGN